METTHLTRGTKRRYSGGKPARKLYDGDGEIAHVTDNAPEGAFDTCPETATLAHCRSNGGVSVLSHPKSEPMARDLKPQDRGEDYFRNLYSTELNFYHLGLKHPEFAAVLTDDVHLDFSDPTAGMQLTKTLLKEDFGLSIDLPPDRLCPPVPNRHNYILWLKDLLDSTSSSYSEQYEPERKVIGLDIGTGASLIYPLLGCAQRPGWSFIATDIDAQSLACARTNACLNNLQSCIHIVQRLPSQALIPLDDLDIHSIDFVMVNPPFYASDAELLNLAAQKSQPPHSACTGAPVEMVCEGGEVKFIERLIDESFVLRGRVQWYTAMLGKQSSLEVLIEILKKHKVNNFAVTTFIQGSKTRRWGIAWSFLSRRPSLSASRGPGSIPKKLMPPITAITIYEEGPQVPIDPIPQLKSRLFCVVKSLDLYNWAWDDQRLRGVGFAQGNVWNRAYRRKRAVEGVSTKQEASVPLSDVTAFAFGFSLSILQGSPDQPSSRPAFLLRWLQGGDELLFESFAGVIRRRLREDANSSG